MRVKEKIPSFKMISIIYIHNQISSNKAKHKIRIRSLTLINLVILILVNKHSRKAIINITMRMAVLYNLMENKKFKNECKRCPCSLGMRKTNQRSMNK